MFQNGSPTTLKINHFSNIKKHGQELGKSDNFKQRKSNRAWHRLKHFHQENESLVQVISWEKSVKIGVISAERCKSQGHNIFSVKYSMTVKGTSAYEEKKEKQN